MKKPDVDVLRSLCELHRSNHFQRFVEWVRETNNAYQKDFAFVSEEDLKPLQGRSRELSDLLHHIETAYEVLKARIEEQEINKVIQQPE